MQIGSVVWEEFLHIRTYIHTYILHTHGIGLSIRVTLNTKPASQVMTRRVAVYLGTHCNIGSKSAFPTSVLDR